MDDRWLQLSPAERLDQRLQWFSTPIVPFASPEAEKAYLGRVRRLVDVYKVQEPDRVPVSLPVGAFPAYLYGLDYRTVMYDHGKATEAWLRFNQEFNATIS